MTDSARREADRDERPQPQRWPSGRWPMAERSLVPTVLGVPPVAAVGLAALLTIVGVFIDLTQLGSLGMVFTICHLTGCVLAVAWVRRRGLFGPMVQPPLLVAAAVPLVVLVAGYPRPDAGLAERLLVIGAPLVNAFPVMAGTTGLVLAVGAFRIWVQRPLEGARPPVSDWRRTPPERSSASGSGAPGGARTSTSPRRS